MSRDTWSTRLRIAGNDASAVEKVLADGGGNDTLQVAGRAVLRCAPSPGLASRLRDEISGPKVFRRFQTELSRHDDEYRRWHRFRDDARLGHARAWLAEHGYRSTR